jgi:hypothetical protein
MAYTLQQLSDMEDIKIVKHRYFRGIDTADMKLLSGLFTQDVTVIYRGGGYRVELAGHADMMVFLESSFHAAALAMHHGHMPEITITGEDEAEGIWYLEDIFIDLVRQDHTYGTAIYHDRYRREGGVWKIAHTEYDRIMEVVQPIDANAKITVHHLAKTGLKPELRADISHMIQWDE